MIGRLVCWIQDPLNKKFEAAIDKTFSSMIEQAELKKEITIRKHEGSQSGEQGKLITYADLMVDLFNHNVIGKSHSTQVRILCTVTALNYLDQNQTQEPPFQQTPLATDSVNPLSGQIEIDESSSSSQESSSQEPEPNGPNGLNEDSDIDKPSSISQESSSQDAGPNDINEASDEEKFWDPDEPSSISQESDEEEFFEIEEEAWEDWMANSTSLLTNPSSIELASTPSSTSALSTDNLVEKNALDSAANDSIKKITLSETQKNHLTDLLQEQKNKGNLTEEMTKEIESWCEKDTPSALEIKQLLSELEHSKHAIDSQQLDIKIKCALLAISCSKEKSSFCEAHYKKLKKLQEENPAVFNILRKNSTESVSNEIKQAFDELQNSLVTEFKNKKLNFDEEKLMTFMNSLPKLAEPNEAKNPLLPNEIVEVAVKKFAEFEQEKKLFLANKTIEQRRLVEAIHSPALLELLKRNHLLKNDFLIQRTFNYLKVALRDPIFTSFFNKQTSLDFTPEQLERLEKSLIIYHSINNRHLSEGVIALFGPYIQDAKQSNNQIELTLSPSSIVHKDYTFIQLQIPEKITLSISSSGDSTTVSFDPLIKLQITIKKSTYELGFIKSITHYENSFNLKEQADWLSMEGELTLHWTLRGAANLLIKARNPSASINDPLWATAKKIREDLHVKEQ